MSTPSYSEARSARRRVPVRRYLLAIPIAIVAFLVLAIIEEREVFFPPERPRAPGAESTAPIERVVRDLAAAIERAYAGGPAPSAMVSEELAAAIAAEIEFARRRGEPPLRLARLDLLRVDPAGEGAFSVTTDETWMTGPEGEASRLRWRYRVLTNTSDAASRREDKPDDGDNQGHPRVEEMTPLIPRVRDERR